jgi:Family of unknown function (DUF6338)
MSIAFQALVLLALALPGIIFRRCYSRTGHQFREAIPIADELVKGLVFAIVLQAVWVALFGGLGLIVGTGVSLRATLMLMSGQFGKDGALFEEALDSVTRMPHPVWIFFYFTSACLVSAWLGQRCRAWCDNAQRIGSKHHGHTIALWLHSLNDDGPHLRRWGEWIQDLDPPTGMSAVKLLTAVVPLGDVPYLYCGLLKKVWFDSNGIPDRFVLTGARRRKIDDNEEGAGGNVDRFYLIKGDSFIIRLSEATTLNLLWVGLFDLEEIAPDDPEEAREPDRNMPLLSPQETA